MSAVAPSVAFQGRLPGLRCEPALPPAVDDTIRLDVAAFVGFAERGPVDTPVAVEDPEQYRAIFGEDLPLARTPIHPRSHTIYAHKLQLWRPTGDQAKARRSIATYCGLGVANRFGY